MNITFEDLVFEPYPYPGCQQASADLGNGYRISVIQGTPFASNGIDTYEVGIVYCDEFITVYEHLTAEQINQLINNITKAPL
ncbi:MAG: hypothetical protein IJE18_07095 [Bacteroidaceae bacterium]|nr:hypothetical protein [Bacteroidaceae bacterium]